MAHVLVAEDDPAIRALIVDALTAEGHSVEAAANGAQVLEHLRLRRPDALVLDLMMPVVDGWGVLAAMNELPTVADTPVLVLSAVLDRVTFVADPRLRGVLAKPFDVEQLLDSVKRLVEPSPPRRRRSPARDAASGWPARSAVEHSSTTP